MLLLSWDYILIVTCFKSDCNFLSDTVPEMHQFTFWVGRNGLLNKKLVHKTLVVVDELENSLPLSLHYSGICPLFYCCTSGGEGCGRISRGLDFDGGPSVACLESHSSISVDELNRSKR